MEIVKISTEYIKLDALLKFAAIAGSGGDAKFLVQSGGVKVNNDVCTQRGRKIHAGDKVECGGKIIAVEAE